MTGFVRLSDARNRKSMCKKVDLWISERGRKCDQKHHKDQRKLGRMEQEWSSDETLTTAPIITRLSPTHTYVSVITARFNLLRR